MKNSHAGDVQSITGVPALLLTSERSPAFLTRFRRERLAGVLGQAGWPSARTLMMEQTQYLRCVHVLQQELMRKAG